MRRPRHVDEDEAAHRPAAFEGDLSYFAIPELIQLVCTGRHDVEISIIDGAQIGSLLVRGGRIFRCALDSSSGARAFFQLARMRSGRFRVMPTPVEGEADDSLLPYSWQGLLLEAARLEDEAKREAGLARPSPKRAEIAEDDPFDLFDSPSPLPNSAVVERVEEGGQLIPFPRKSAEELPKDASLAAMELTEMAPKAPNSAPHSAPSRPSAPPTLPSASLRSNKAAPPRARRAAVSPVSPPLAERTPERAVPPGRQSSPCAEPPESDPAPLSLQPIPSHDPMKAPGTLFAQLIQDATAAYLRRDYDRALVLFEECLSMDPSDRRVQHNIERIKNRRSRA